MKILVPSSLCSQVAFGEDIAIALHPLQSRGEKGSFFTRGFTSFGGVRAVCVCVWGGHDSASSRAGQQDSVFPSVRFQVRFFHWLP